MTIKVMGRLRDPSDSDPKFTQACHPDELLAELAKRIPVDLVYAMIPHDDGLGYSLREVGQIVFDIHYVNEPQPRVTPLPSFSHPSQAQTRNDTSQPLIMEPIPREEDLFRVPPPKSQAELLAEAGIVERKVNLAPPKSKKKVKSQEEDDTNLPHTRSLGAKMVATGFSEATPAEAEAASKHAHLHEFK